MCWRINVVVPNADFQAHYTNCVLLYILCFCVYLDMFQQLRAPSSNFPNTI